MAVIKAISTVYTRVDSGRQLSTIGILLGLAWHNGRIAEGNDGVFTYARARFLTGCGPVAWGLRPQASIVYFAGSKNVRGAAQSTRV